MPSLRCHYLLALLPLAFSVFSSQAEEHPLVTADPDTLLRIQIFLDDRDLRPGQLDGRFGRFTEQAIELFNLQSLREAIDWPAVVTEATNAVPVPLTTHVVSAQDFTFIGTVAETIPEQAAQKSLPYQTYLEFLAERYHSHEPFLEQINPNFDLEQVSEGETLIVPNIKNVFKIEEIPRSYHYPDDPSKLQNYIYIDIAKQRATIFEGTTILAAFPISHGTEEFVPKGEWALRAMVTTPTFRWDERMLKEGQESEVFHLLPPGPNNLVGVLWCNINKRGIGLHGTNHPELIGRTQSAGCIRFANWDVIRLPHYLSPGSVVIID